MLRGALKKRFEKKNGLFLQSNWMVSTNFQLSFPNVFFRLWKISKLSWPQSPIPCWRNSGLWLMIKFVAVVNYQRSLVFLGPSSKMRERSKWPRAWLKAPSFLGCCSTLRSRSCTPLTKSEEKERLLTVYGSRGKLGSSLLGFSLHLKNFRGF